MYNTSFVCTYQLFNDDNPDDASELYKIQLLQAFNIDNWNDDIVSQTIDSLYTEMKELDIIQQVIEKIKVTETYTIFIGNDNETAFRFLFGYDIFYLMHKCICEFRNSYSISKSTCDAIMNKL
tara:strand:+ start:101 stop:469 length:369 start_codon:yes stop_codon:yes gene_type:complete